MSICRPPGQPQITCFCSSGADCCSFIVLSLLLAAGMYSDSFQVQLQHLADTVLCVQSLADNSDIYRLLPDPTR